MTIKRIPFKLSTLLFAFFFIFGIQNSLDAQITVKNATNCTITVYIGQLDASTFTPCDLCPINLPTPITIPAMTTLPIFGQDVCGETFGWIAWQVGGAFNFGVSNNPGLFATCQTNSFGTGCFSFVTSATWNSSGVGPVSVTIQ